MRYFFVSIFTCSTAGWLNGFILVSLAEITVSRIKYENNSPIVSYKGLPVLEKDDFLNDIENLVEKVSSTFSLINPKQKDNLIESVKIASRKLVKEKTGKKPITNINIVRI